MTVLPQGWKIVTLGEVARWGSGGTPTAGRSDYYGGSIPWAVIGDLADGPVRETRATITAKALQASSAKLVPPGAVLVAMYGSIGKLGITEVEMATNQAIAFAVPNPDLDNKYLFHYLRSERDGLSRAGKGAAQQNIGQAILKSWPIPLPPLDEQRRILDILEDHLSRLDAGTRTLEAQSARLTALRLSSLNHAKKSLIEEGTRTVRIADMASTHLGKMLDARRATGTPTPYLRNINVRWGTIDLTDVSEVPLSEQERERFALSPGDLLVCEGGEPGRCAVWPGSAALMTFQKALHRVRFADTTTDPHFVALMLEQVIRSGNANKLITGTTIKHLPQEKLRLIAIPLPTGDRQREVVQQVRMVTEAATALEAGITMALERAKNLRGALLDAAFSGHLTGRSSDLDHAEELASV